jgi:hypothetical protein
MVPHSFVIYDGVSCINPSIGTCTSTSVVLSVRATIHPWYSRSFSTDPLLAVLSRVPVVIVCNALGGLVHGPMMR